MLGVLAWLAVLTLPALLQWIVLRTLVRRTGWWILASSIGSLLGFLPLAWGLAVADTRGETIFARIAVPTAFLLSGTVTGFVEWLSLRRWFLRAGWWVLGRCVGSFAAIYAFASITRGADVRYFLGGAVSGALSAVVTGLVLVLLFRNLRINAQVNEQMV
jgi:hypothetical protein